MSETEVMALILVVVLIVGALAWKNRTKIPGLRGSGGGGKDTGTRTKKK